MTPLVTPPTARSPAPLIEAVWASTGKDRVKHSPIGAAITICSRKEYTQPVKQLYPGSANQAPPQQIIRSAADEGVPARTVYAIARSVPAGTRTATSRVARGGWKADKAHRSAAEECTGAPGLGTPGCSPSPVDYAIYGIIHSA